ncbi:hypothetical protein HPP92_026201 [Vanilla planifolia]|uniref:Uncharacterized protein n=1 Tax=Vanilla planifolia TaxID=51239 RepID=A0A835UA98_VANPL|nr:hypothetical protein HPP92_026201 [Vanilla planifolia]
MTLATDPLESSEPNCGPLKRHLVVIRSTKPANSILAQLKALITPSSSCLSSKTVVALNFHCPHPFHAFIILVISYQTHVSSSSDANIEIH